MTFEDWWEGGHRGLLAERECRELWNAAYQAGMQRAAEIADDERKGLMECGNKVAALGASYAAKTINAEIAAFHAASRQAENSNPTT